MSARRLYLAQADCLRMNGNDSAVSLAGVTFFHPEFTADLTTEFAD